MGAVGVHRTMDRFRDRGFEPIELERYCGSNKIWTTKVKRLRLPDLLCVKTGMRAEVRAKTDLKIRMSDAPANLDRVWDAGLRDDDIVAVITCFDRDDGPEPADDAVYFTRLLHKLWHVIVTRTPTFRVANASQNSPCSIRPCHDCRPIASVAYPHRR